MKKIIQNKVSILFFCGVFLIALGIGMSFSFNQQVFFIDSTKNQNKKMRQEVDSSLGEDTPVYLETPIEQSSYDHVSDSFDVPVDHVEDSSFHTFTEDDVIRYFQDEELALETYQTEEEISFREKVTSGFFTIIDFIFYEKPVKGHTFQELTLTAKLKVIQIATRIDSKIDEYFPSYKDSIKGVYQNIKGKLVALYLDTTSKICEGSLKEACVQAREDFKVLKKNFGITFDLIKDLAKAGTSSLKEWYESLR